MLLFHIIVMDLLNYTTGYYTWNCYKKGYVHKIKNGGFVISVNISEAVSVVYFKISLWYYRGGFEQTK